MSRGRTSAHGAIPPGDRTGSGCHSAYPLRCRAQQALLRNACGTHQASSPDTCSAAQETA